MKDICPDCGGSGGLPYLRCCQRPTISGECCGDPDMDMEPCQRCETTGCIEIPDPQPHQQGTD